MKNQMKNKYCLDEKRLAKSKGCAFAGKKLWPDS